MIKIIPIIFARSGSKGIINKNIKLLNNKPLIAYTIQTALRSKYVDDIYISTDSLEYAEIAERYGAKIPFIRKKELAKDNSPELDSWKDAINFFKKKHYDFIFLVLPCVTPLKTVKNIDDTIELYLERNPDLVYTCMEPFRNPYFNIVKEKSDKSLQIFDNKTKFYRRQDVPLTYDLTPSVLVTSPNYILGCSNFFDGNVIPSLVTREEGIDIDDQYDFKIAELILKEKSIDYILCGLGSIGQRHLNNILECFPQIKIGILRKEKSNDEKFKNIPVFTRFEETLEHNPKAFIICTPTAYHMDIAIKCAENNIDTFIEKPIDVSLEKVSKFIELIEKKNLKCMVGYDLRFHPGIIKLKELLNSDLIGQIYSIDVQVGQYLPFWRPNQDYSKGTSSKKKDGGGVINDLIHEIDYVTYLLGDIKSVTSIYNKLSNLDIETEDMAKILVEFEKSIGYIHLDYLQKAYSRTCKIIGEKGTIEWDYVKEEIIFKNELEEKKIYYKIQTRNDRFKNEIEYFINCIENNTPCLPNHNDGYKTLNIVNKIKESYLKKKNISI